MKYAFLLAALLSGNAWAEFMTGNDLLRLAEANNRVTSRTASDADYQDSSQFFGYLQGAFDANRNLVCPPSGFTTGQLSEIVKKFIRNNPEKLHFTGDVIVLLAMSESFTCKQTKK